ncbi:alpha-1A adrenergic receptor-like [Asterias amurensis]|uniref:alpha-1A adrenergic receptor-like n=1 Tax=Asterias amurensis TaxID=7602 RepID=UPI003AB4FEBB
MAETHQILTILKILMPLVGSIGFVGNVLVCVTIIYTKKLHNVTNLMILNLAVADALVSVVAPLYPFLAVNFILNVSSPSKTNSNQCTANTQFLAESFFIHSFFLDCFSAHSVLSLTLSNFERFIGISRPLQYTSYFTRRKITLLLLAVWVIPVLVHLPQLLITVVQYRRDNCSINELQKPLVTGIAAMLLLLLPIAATIWMYIRILINLKQGVRNLEEQGIQGPAQELHQAHKKVTSTLAIITTAFFILVLPGALWFSFSHWIIEGETSTSIIIWELFLFLSFLNSVINPVLYGFKYDQLRKAFISMVCRCNQRRQTNQIDPL